MCVVLVDFYYIWVNFCLNMIKVFFDVCVDRVLVVVCVWYFVLMFCGVCCGVYVFCGCVCVFD